MDLNMATRIEERLKKLKDLREKLCNKQSEWKEAYRVKDWVVDELKRLHAMSQKSDTTVDCLKGEIGNILDLIEPKANGCKDD